jgi:hypothetical protein
LKCAMPKNERGHVTRKWVGFPGGKGDALGNHVAV